jgi:hypothetical protein
MAFLTAASGICAFFSTSLAFGLSIPAALACLAFAAWAPGIVMAIAGAHREAGAEVPVEGLPG